MHGHVLSDFAKSDKEWLEVLLDLMADSADLLTKGDDNGFMNKVTAGLRDKLQPTSADAPPAAEGAQAAYAEGPEPHSPGPTEPACGQASRDRPHGCDAEEAARQGLRGHRIRPASESPLTQDDQPQ